MTKKTISMLAVLTLHVATAPRANAQALIHEYRFDGNGTDSAGHAHGVVGAEVDFTSIGVPVGLGQAATFGTGSPYDAADVIEVDKALFTGFGTGDFSIATWVRRTNTSGRGDIIDANGFAGDGPGFQLQITSAANQVRLRIDDDNGFTRPDSVGLIDDTQWHHIVVTVDRDDSQGFKYYIDGMFDSAHDPRSVPGGINPPQALRFGSQNETGSFVGEIALLQFFDSALTRDEVDRLFCGAGEDCDGVADACELRDVTITFGDQPVGPLAAYSYLGYDISPLDDGALVVRQGSSPPSFSSTVGGVGTMRIVASGGELFEFVLSDYALDRHYVQFDGYVDGAQTQTQSAATGGGILASTFTAPIDELRVAVSARDTGDALVDNIVLKRVDDCNTNGVPDACETDCNGNGIVDACESLPDHDGDGVLDVCDRCRGGDDALDSDGDGVADNCDACPGGDDNLDADGDGIANHCDSCAGGVGSADADGDGDREWDDHAKLAACLSGPGGKLGAGCVCFDIDDDGDIDLNDVRDFQARFAPALGCYIDGKHYAPLERNAFPRNCEQCRPLASKTRWTLMPHSTVCREGSGDACDPTESCTGSSPVCPADVISPATTVCRAGSGEACDPDEYCTGVSGEACPPDKVAAHTTMCRAAGGVCDVVDFCSGVPGEACQNVMKSTSTVCQDNSGTCTADKTCDGINADCPSGSSPRDVGSSCDTNSSCSGAGVCGDQSGNINCVCPGITRCWPRQGACDADDFYDENGECVADTIHGTSHVCQDNTGRCVEDVKCDGTSKECPGVIQNKISGNACISSKCLDSAVCNESGGCVCPDLDVCREAVGACDRPETYTSFGTCPADGLYGLETVCRREFDPFNVSDASCNPPEYCDGQSINCPADVELSVGDVCRTSGECDAEYRCYGKCAVNPDNGPGPTAPLCLSNADCNAGETCMAPFAFPLECRKDGTTPANGTPCNNGADACQDGECTGLIVSEGGQCDGDDWFFIGDVNGFHCDNGAAEDLFCCKGGGLAKTGETGTCKKCCGNRGEENGGCPQNNERFMACCGGECVNLESDLYNCGACGNDCQARADNSPCLINPQCGVTPNDDDTLAECFFGSACGSDYVCNDGCLLCSLYGDCDTCGGFECQHVTFEYDSCAPCLFNSDCTKSIEQCWSSCGGSNVEVLGGVCTDGGHCSEESGACSSGN